MHPIQKYTVNLLSDSVSLIVITFKFTLKKQFTEDIIIITELNSAEFKSGKVTETNSVLFLFAVYITYHTYC